MSDKLISKNYLMKALQNWDDEHTELFGITEAIKLVANAPVIEDVAPVVHAKVIENGLELKKCSKCGHVIPYDVDVDSVDIVDYWECNYCINCGAKMDGGVDN